MAANVSEKGSSSEACQAFKTKVSDSLSLLRYLNEDDKLDIWKFWKTVSSAVKIAVNGKGDAVSSSKRFKASEWQNKDSDCDRVLNLEKNATAVYFPLKSSNAELGRYRVLKIINLKTVADYEIDVPLKGDVPQEQNPFEDIDKTFNSSDLSHEEILQQAIFSHNDSSNNHLVSSSKENSEHQPSSSQSSDNTNSQSHGKRKAIIWPVSRPATRSISKKQNSQSVKNDSFSFSESNITCDSTQENVISFTNDIIEQQKITDVNESPVSKEHSLAQSNRLESILSKNYNEDRHDVSVPISGYGVVSIGNGEDVENVKATGINNQEQEQGHDVNLQLDNKSIQVSSMSNELSIKHEQNSHTDRDQERPLRFSGENSDSLVITNSQPIVTALNEPLSTDVQEIAIKTEEPVLENDSHNVHGQLENRSTSDIETIISALEEELKKNGGDVGSISFTSGKEGTADVLAGTSEQVVQFIPGQEIVEIQNGEGVIWASGGDVQVTTVPHTPIEASPAATAAAHGTVVEDGGAATHIDPQYDVVEYEIFADKEKTIGTGGRKKKIKNIGEGKDVLDRTCPMCHRVLTYASSMAAHIRIHTGDRPYSCGQCDRKFTTKANRDRHEATHVGLKPFKCTDCDKSFTEKRSLKIHMRTHTGEKPFECTTCGRGFAQKCTLLVHMDRHTNKKGHLCDLCGKAFRQKCQLDIHVKRHKREANHPCTLCSIKCYTKGDLMRHMIKHTGERPYECALCSRTFTRKQYLMDHENTHYGRKPYKCSICSQAFYDMGSCHRHLRKHRQEEEGETSGAITKKLTSLFSTEDFNVLLKGFQTGQMITLDDGTKAMIKAVESEADGSLVYHISCVGDDLVPKAESDVNETETESTEQLPKVEDQTSSENS